VPPGFENPLLDGGGVCVATGGVPPGFENPLLDGGGSDLATGGETLAGGFEKVEAVGGLGLDTDGGGLYDGVLGLDTDDELDDGLEKVAAILGVIADKVTVIAINDATHRFLNNIQDPFSKLNLLNRL
jgi:hypothetical protein